MSDPDAILDALAGGLSIRKAAKQFDGLEAEIRKILKKAVDLMHPPKNWSRPSESGPPPTDPAYRQQCATNIALHKG